MFKQLLASTQPGNNIQFGLIVTKTILAPVITDTRTTKTLSLQWCVLARQTSTFSFQNISSIKEGLVSAQVQTVSCL